uniref:Exosome component 1 n=1 Tax=Hucho hucho TaxID=62062 RepID=A0A4W5Q4Z0_9TELE
MTVVVLPTLVESTYCKSLWISAKSFSACVCVCVRAGDRLCSTEDCMPGTGVYLRHGYIYSSLAGYVLRKNEGEELPVISVVRETEAQLLPDVGAIVTCKVRFGELLMSTTDVKEDVRATEKDRYISVSLLSGAQMVPISWCEMQCPRTHAKEFRKVARVQPEYLQA